MLEDGGFVTRTHGSRCLLKILATSILLLTRASGISACGEFTDATTTTLTGTLTSPNYPSNYNNQDKCVWLIQAPNDYNVQLTVTGGVSGEADSSGSCVDYVEVRNGASSQSLLYGPTCSGTTTTTVTSASRWMWIVFQSDRVNTSTGFTASWSLVADANGTTGDASPIPKCLGAGLQYQCTNKECVSYSYKCDGYNDCGCSTDGCDEIGCTNNFADSAVIGIGVSLGIAVFCLIFFGLGALDIYLKRRAETKYKEKLEENRRRLKREKAQARERQDSSTGTGPDISRRPSELSSALGDLYARPKTPKKKPARPPSAITRMNRTFRAGSKPI